MSSGFVTATELAEARKKRQEEWEKVRQPDQPLEAPEEQYDSRSLFDRLKEQKDKKDLEYEEAHKLKNLIRGLDDDEVDFLEIIDKAKLAAEKKKQLEENSELNEFRQRVASLQEKSIDEKINAETALLKPKTITKMSQRPSQKSILAGVVRKRAASENTEETNGSTQKSPTVPEKIPKNSESSDDSEAQAKNINNDETLTKSNNSSSSSTTLINDVNLDGATSLDNGALKCIGILPGIGKYRESSDSENSTDTNDEYDFSEFDWMGKKKKKQSVNDDCCH